MEKLEQETRAGAPAQSEDQIFGELLVVRRRLERIQQLAGQMAVRGSREKPWVEIGDQCEVAGDALRAAAELVPYGPLELVPRASDIDVRELRLDTAARRAWFAGSEVALSHQEYELLRALAKDPFEVRSKSDLLREVWNYRSAGRTRTVDSHASRVRRKLIAGGATQNEWVINVWGVGYALLRPRES
jgi:DNA-binding response OmpR family regulator